MFRKSTSQSAGSTIPRQRLTRSAGKWGTWKTILQRRSIPARSLTPSPTASRLLLTQRKSHLPCGTPAYLRTEADPVLTPSMQEHLQILFGIGRGKHLPDTPLPIGLRQISLLKTSLMLRQANTAVSVFPLPGLTARSSAIPS